MILYAWEITSVAAMKNACSELSKLKLSFFMTRKIHKAPICLRGNKLLGFLPGREATFNLDFLCWVRDHFIIFQKANFFPIYNLSKKCEL
jgi:hypothetical protein